MSVSYRCEHDFWKESYRLHMDEPVAAVSGLVMSAIAIWGTPMTNPPLQFCIARASLVLCGLGTFTYHALGDKEMDALHLNGIIFDGVSMALVTVNVFLLYLTEWMKTYNMAVAVSVLFYLFFWVVTNDLLTFKYLSDTTEVNGISLFSIAVQYPSFVAVYIYIIYRVAAGSKTLTQHWKLWLSLIVSLSAWCADEFTCQMWQGVFVGHTIWHIGIGYVANYLMAVGAAETYGLRFSSDDIFPKLEYSQRITQNAMIAQNSVSTQTSDVEQARTEYLRSPTLAAPMRIRGQLSVQGLFGYIKEC